MWCRGAEVWMAERIMVGLPVSIDQTGLRTYRQLAPVGNLPVPPLRLCEAEGLLAQPFVWFSLRPPESHEPGASLPPYGPPQWAVDKVFSNRC